MGKNHPEFGSSRQQDSQEFFMHMLDQIEKHHQKVNLNEKDKIRMRIQGWGECRAAGLLPSVHG